MGKYLEIVVTVNWCHEYFGGHRISEKRFPLSRALEAEEYFMEKSSNDCAYQHTTIQIVCVDGD